MKPSVSNYISSLEIHTSINWDSILQPDDLIITTKTPYEKYPLKGKAVVISSNKFVEIKTLLDVRHVKRVIGVGGGTAIDVAKTVASKRTLPMIAIPTILSTNVFSTNKSTIFFDKITSISTTIPNKVIIDLSILKSSSQRYLLAGLADIMSIHTASKDWEIASFVEPINLPLYEISKSLLKSAKLLYPLLKEPTEFVIQQFVFTLLYAGYITNTYTNGRPESGSEHMVSRAIDELYSDLHILHGESVLFGILAMSIFQNNEDDFLFEVAKDMTLLKILKENLTKKDLVQSLLYASTIRPERFSIFSIKNMNSCMANGIVEKIFKRLENDEDITFL